MLRLRVQFALLLLGAVFALLRRKRESAEPVAQGLRPHAVPEPPQQRYSDGYVNLCTYSPFGTPGFGWKHTHMDRDGYVRAYEGAECISWPPKIASA